LSKESAKLKEQTQADLIQKGLWALGFYWTTKYFKTVMEKSPPVL